MRGNGNISIKSRSNESHESELSWCVETSVYVMRCRRWNKYCVGEWIMHTTHSDWSADKIAMCDVQQWSEKQQQRRWRRRCCNVGEIFYLWPRWWIMTWYMRVETQRGKLCFSTKRFEIEMKKLNETLEKNEKNYLFFDWFCWSIPGGIQSERFRWDNEGEMISREWLWEWSDKIEGHSLPLAWKVSFGIIENLFWDPLKLLHLNRWEGWCFCGNSLFIPGYH